MPQPIEVRKVPILKVTDASGLEELIDKGVFRADDVIAVVGKTEGNGGVNDYTRILADRAFREVLVEKGTRSWDEVTQVPLAWSGGTDGILSPHATIFAHVPAEKAPSHRRAAAVGRLRDERADPARGHRPRRDGREGRRRRARSPWSGPASPTRRTCTTSRPRRRCSCWTPSTTPRRVARRSWTEETGLRRWTCPTAPPRSASPYALGEIDDADRRADHARPVALLVGGVLLVRRGAGPGPDRAGRQRPRHRRALPRRARRDAGRARLHAASGRPSATPA